MQESKKVKAQGARSNTSMISDGCHRRMRGPHRPVPRPIIKLIVPIKMLHDVILPMGLDRALYALVILLPLIYSSHVQVRHFGMLVALSLLISLNIYSYAFVSVWCFFAALLSLYLIYVFRQQEA